MKNLKKIVAVILIAVMCVLGAAALAEGKIQTTTKVNVRSGAGTNNSVLGTAAKGKVLNFDKTAKDGKGVIWYHVITGQKGWICSSNTTQLSGEVSGKNHTKVTGTTVKASGRTVKATGDANLRKGPGLDYANVGMMKAGKTATFKGEAKKDARGVVWYKVKFNGRTGWISSRYGKLMK